MWKLAWRNLWRNRARSIIILSAIALTYSLALIMLGTQASVYGQMEQAAAKTAGGNIVIHGEGYWDDQSAKYAIANPQQVLEAIDAVEGVERVSQRVYINGLVTSSRGNGGVRLIGVLPEVELEIEDYRQYLVAGDFLGHGGDAQAPVNTKDPIVLGADLVAKLKVELGDRIVLTASDSKGEVVRTLFHLSGVLKTGVEEIDKGGAFTTVAQAQEALGYKNQLSQIGVFIDDDDNRQQVKAALTQALGEAKLELLTWDEAIPEMVSFIQIDRRFGYLYDLVLFVIVAFGIANTLLMAVKERIRELGLLGAIGLAPKGIAQLVLAETLMMAVLALALGFGLGFAGHSYLASSGIKLKDLYGSNLETAGVTMTDGVLSSAIDPIAWGGASIVVLLLVLLSAIYPAWRASRLDPASAMRSYE